MRVFVTGASGWIGSAVVPELLGAGHDVVALARSQSSADALLAAGVDVVRGDLDDLELLGTTSAAADGVLHLAFKHDQAFSGNFQGAADADHDAIKVIGDALVGTDRPFLIASGVMGLSPGRLGTERDGHDVESMPAHLSGGPATRLLNAELTLALAERGVRSGVVRLPPTVHGDGDNGFIATTIGIARSTGVAGYVGDGSNHWPAVHRSDAARLFRLALENAPAGSTLHAVAEEGVVWRDIADVIGRHLDVPATSIAVEDADAHFTWLARFVGADCLASSTLTRELLDWTPTGPGLLEDLEQGHYFTQS